MACTLLVAGIRYQPILPITLRFCSRPATVVLWDTLG